MLSGYLNLQQMVSHELGRGIVLQMPNPYNCIAYDVRQPYVITSFFCLEMVADEITIIGEPTIDLVILLESYADVFKKSTGLPPSRSHDHKIHLNSRAQPVNMKPYRYPYFQRQVMDKLVAEILRERVFRPNTSPFLSPGDIGSQEGCHMETLC